MKNVAHTAAYAVFAARIMGALTASQGTTPLFAGFSPVFVYADRQRVMTT